MLLLALLPGQTLTLLYVNNDVASEGPLTELSPARIANMMTALHDVLLWKRAAGGGGAARAGDPRLRLGQTTRFALSDDHRSEDSAGQRASSMCDASNTRACFHRLRGRRGRRDRVLPMTITPRRYLLYLHGLDVIACIATHRAFHDGARWLEPRTSRAGAL